MHRLLPTIISLTAPVFTIFYVGLVGVSDSSILNLFIGIAAFSCTCLVAVAAMMRPHLRSEGPSLFYAAVASALIWVIYAIHLTNRFHLDYPLGLIGHLGINVFAFGLAAATVKELRDLENPD